MTAAVYHYSISSQVLAVEVFRDLVIMSIYAHSGGNAENQYPCSFTTAAWDYGTDDF